MASDAASSTGRTYDPGPLEADWRDEAWIAIVGWFDRSLRSYYGIQEFTDDPHCLLRIGPMPAQMPLALSDGTTIREGELVGALHIWNEHVPRYSGNGPSLAWAKEMRRRMLYSIGLLAAFAERDPQWSQVPAFFGVSTLSSRLGEVRMRQLAQRHGFDAVEPPPSLWRPLRLVADAMVVWGLTRAFNPAALRRQKFLRDHCELWISHSRLLKLYGREARTAAAALPERVA
jgi:YkoP domain